MEAEAERLRIAREEKSCTRSAAAVKAERRRVAHEAEEKRVADAKRAANVAHMRKFNAAALADMMASVVGDGTMDENLEELYAATCKLIVTAIAKGAIRT